MIDSSALVAILLGESEAARLVQAITADPRRLLAAFSAFETAVVMDKRRGPAGGRELDLFIHKAGIDIVSMTSEHVEIARNAYARFGKGRHPAALNLGDCCSYATAMHSGEPLLFKGDDFEKTDIAAAAY